MRALPWCLLPTLVFAGSAAFAQSHPISDQEKQFLSIVDDFAAKYKAAPNDMAKGGLRPQRAKAICDLMKSPEVADWVGTVRALSSNNVGKTDLLVSLRENNTLAEVGIEPGTPLHDAAMQLKEKQSVVFSGTFAEGDEDCFKQNRFTQINSMSTPIWQFSFSEIKPAH